MKTSDNKKNKINWQFLLIILIGLVFRLILAVFGNHIDLIINAGWGNWLFVNGPKNFYTNTVWIYSWPTQLPLINLIYSYCNIIYTKIIWDLTYISQTLAKFHFSGLIVNPLKVAVIWFGWKNFSDTPFLNGLLYSMKLIPIFSDVLIGIIYYLVGKNVRSKNIGLFYCLLFLFLPFSWYVSSLWGQYDQVSCLLLLLAFLSAYYFDKWPYLQPISFVFLFASLEIKPNLFIVLPLFAAVILSQKYKIQKIIIGAVTSILLFVLTTFPFSGKKLLTYFFEKIIPVVLNPDRLGLATHVFNFWSLLSPKGGWADKFALLGIKAEYLGVIALLFVSYLSVKTYLKNKNIKGIITGVFIAAGGMYIFGTGMVDRYYYLGIISLGLVSIYYSKLKKFWIIAALIFSFNLFYSWGYPFLTENTVWKNNLLIQIMSLIQVIIYILSVFTIKKSENAKNPLLRHN